MFNNGSTAAIFRASVGPTKSDLIIENLVVNPTSGAPGSVATVSFTIKNQGGGSANMSTTNIRINSSSSGVTTGDTLLASIATPNIPSGGTVAVYQSVAIPTDRPIGTNYVWVVADIYSSANQSDETNDKSSVPFTTTVLGKASINAISPTSGAEGTVVVIQGSGFGAKPKPGSSYVSFDTVQASVNSWANRRIEAVAPGSLSGTVPVTVTTGSGKSNHKDFTYLTTPNSQVWQKVTGPWSADCDTSFGAIAAPPANSNVIYIGSSHPTAGCGLYKSSDTGQTWKSINKGIRQVGLGQSKHYPAVTKISIAPSNDNILYAGTFIDSPLGPFGGVYRSTDGGKKWVDASGEVSIFGISQINTPVLDIAVDPQNASVVVVGLLGAGVYKTTDGGINWTRIRAGTATIDATDYFSIVRISESNPNVVHVSGFTNITGSVLPCTLDFEHCVDVEGVLPLGPLRSSDGGQNWTAVNNPTPLTASNLASLITDLSVDFSNENILYASTIAYKTPLFLPANNKGIFKSLDGGNSWNPINSGATIDLSLFPLYRVLIDATASDTLYAVAGFEGVFRSIDGGNSWARLTTLGWPSSTFIVDIALGGASVYTLTSSGVYISNNP